MKQSSIEWLMEIDKSRAITIEEWEQAKAMHKDEIENAYWDGGQWVPTVGSQCEEYYNETFNTNREMNQCKCTAPTIATKVSENGIYSYCTKCAEEVKTFNTKEK